MDQTFPHMKPERVQIPSIFPLNETESSCVTWKVNTGSFKTSCAVAKIMSDMLRNYNFQKALNLTDEGIELWMHHTTKEDREDLQRSTPRLKEAVEHYLEEVRSHEEQPETFGV